MCDVIQCHPSSSSTALKELDTMVPPSAAHRHHHHSAPHYGFTAQVSLSCGAGSVHDQHKVLSSPLLFISGPSTPQGRDRDYVGGDGKVNSLDGDDGMLDPSSTFTAMMDFVCKHF